MSGKKLKPVVSPLMCPAHRMWMRKGQCELCRMELEKQQREREELTGSNRQQIKIK